MKIKKVQGREILDCRGVPTIECSITLDNAMSVVASVPAGISRGKFEAHELRDGDKKRYAGMGVLSAVENIENTIAPLIIGKKPDVVEIDSILISHDATSNKGTLGANAILSVSIAVLKAQALASDVGVYKLLSDLYDVKPSLPSVMFNMISGGVHALNSMAFQEFMIMPQDSSFSGSLHKAVSIYNTLRDLLAQEGYRTSVRDEGGFSPLFSDKQPEKQALDMLMRAIELSKIGDVKICLDVAASHFYDEKKKIYVIGDKELSSSDMIAWYEELVKNYPIYSIEDGLDQEGWDGWATLTKKLGSSVQLVGDDLFVTNKERIQKGAQQKVANAVLIKPNQIGSVSEAIDAILLCKELGYKTIVSHRSGETNDSFIADFVVGMVGNQFKAGAPARGERVAKYNRLLQIESEM